MDLPAEVGRESARGWNGRGIASFPTVPTGGRRPGETGRLEVGGRGFRVRRWPRGLRRLRLRTRDRAQRRGLDWVFGPMRPIDESARHPRV